MNIQKKFDILIKNREYHCNIMRHISNTFHIIVALILLQLNLFAIDTQVDLKTKRTTVGDTGIEYYFNIGMAPQLDGSLNMGGDFDMSYYKWLFTGMSFSRSKVAISRQS